MAVHLTKLTADGRKHADEPNKIMLGRARGLAHRARADERSARAGDHGGDRGRAVDTSGTGLGAWAAGSANRMPALADAVPNCTDCVIDLRGCRSSRTSATPPSSPSGSTRAASTPRWCRQREPHYESKTAGRQRGAARRAGPKRLRKAFDTRSARRRSPKPSQSPKAASYRCRSTPSRSTPRRIIWSRASSRAAGSVVVWGPPKCGKSFWTFDLMMHVALGWEYRGRRVQQGAVVYLALEGGHGFRARVEAWRRRHLDRPSRLTCRST